MQGSFGLVKCSSIPSLDLMDFALGAILAVVLLQFEDCST